MRPTHRRDRSSDRGWSTIQVAVAGILSVTVCTALVSVVHAAGISYRSQVQETTSYREYATFGAAFRSALNQATAIRRYTRFPDDPEAVDMLFSYTDPTGTCMAFEVTNYRPNTTTADGTYMDEPYFYWRSGRYVTTEGGTTGTCTKAPSATTYIRWTRCHWTVGRVRQATFDRYGMNLSSLWTVATSGAPNNPATSGAAFCTAKNRQDLPWDEALYTDIARVQYSINDTSSIDGIRSSVTLPYARR